MLLDGKKLLITGVLTDDSIAFAVARVAQEAGAEILLTNFGKGVRITEKVARRLPTTPDVMQMDVNNADDVAPSPKRSRAGGAAWTARCTRSASCRRTHSAGTSSAPRGRAWRSASKLRPTRSRRSPSACSSP